MTTANIDSTLVQLESLHRAYQELLDEAKRQLEGLEVSQSTLESLAEECTSQTPFRSHIAREVYNLFREEFVTGDPDPASEVYPRSRFIADIASKVKDSIIRDVKTEITNVVREIVDSNTIHRAIEKMVVENDSIHSALVI